MRNIFLSIALMFLAVGISSAQNNIRKTAGVNYTSGPPTFTPSLITGSEYAIDTTNGWFYQFHRTTSVWLRLGQGIDKVAVFGPPTYAPVRNISWFAINLGDSLYHYSGTGIIWDCINCATGGGGAIANNGVSDNEDGGKIRLGNRYMASPDAPFTMPRKINIDGRLLHIGDYSDSTLFVVDGATDRIGIRTDAPAKDLHVNGEARISDLTNGTPDRVVGANSSGDISRLFLSGLSVSTGVLRAADSSATNEGILGVGAGGASSSVLLSNTSTASGVTINAAGINTISETTNANGGQITITATEVDGSVTNEIQQIDTFAIVSNILRASLSNDGVPFKSVDLSPYAGNGTVTSFSSGNLNPIFTTGVATATTTPALSFSLTNQTANRVFAGPSSGVAAAPTFRALALADIIGLNTANNGLSDNEAGGGVFRLGNTFMNGSDGLFAADRKVNVNAKMLFIGDNTDSTLFVVDGTNDRVGIGRLPLHRFDVSGSGGIYTRVNTTGAVAISGYILNNSGDANASWAVIRNAGGEFQIGSSTGEWPAGTLTTPFQMEANPPNNSFYMDATGLIAFGGATASRRFDNYGETRLRDLTTTTATLLVGADSDGVLSSLTVGSGLSITGGSLTSTAGTFYQTFRDDNVDRTQRPVANFVSSGRIAATLTDDSPNTETEVSLDVIDASITFAKFQNINTATLLGRTTALSGSVEQLTLNGTLSFSGTTLQRAALTGDVTALAGSNATTIANQAVTYVKMQNAVSDNVLLGNNNGANTSYEEINPAAAQVMLGYVDGNLVAGGRVAYSSDANTLTTEAAFLYNAANDRMTIVSTTPALGAGNAILNLQNAGNDPSGEFLRMDGNITGNLLAGMFNSSTAAATDNTLFYISQAGNSAGDPILQLNITGTNGTSAAIGLDNSDLNKLKLTPNATTPGANVDKSLVATNDLIPKWGINKDDPGYVLDVGGQSRAVQHMFTNNKPTAGAAGNGLGTGGSIGVIGGADNAFILPFTTGATGLTAGGPICTITYFKSWPTFAVPVFCQNNDAAGNEISKFVFGSIDGATFELKVRGGQTLTPSTTYRLSFVVGGQG
jgi:hypothetical protein